MTSTILRRVVLQGVQALSELVSWAAGRISIMAGGGVRRNNVEELVRRSGVCEVHSSGSRYEPPPLQCAVVFFFHVVVFHCYFICQKTRDSTYGLYQAHLWLPLWEPAFFPITSEKGSLSTTIG